MNVMNLILTLICAIVISSYLTLSQQATTGEQPYSGTQAFIDVPDSNTSTQ